MLRSGEYMRVFRNSAYASLLKDGYSDPGIRKLYVRSVGHCGADKNFCEKPRSISYGGFYWCVSGGAVFKLDNRKYRVNAGDVWFYPPGSLTDFRIDEEGMLFYWMALCGDALMPLLDSLNIAAGKKICGPPPEDLFQDLIASVRYSTPDRRIETFGIALQILLKMAVPVTSDVDVRRRSIAAEARLLIEKEFISPDFYIGDLSGRLGVHSVTLCREFKKEFETTPSDYLTSCRLWRALELLESGQYLIKEVASMCGFSSPEYFATVFTAKFACPPSKIPKSEPEK